MSGILMVSSAAVESPKCAEAARLLNICNACRYCEGYCPVFPAMTEHRTFDASTIDYLANLCHQCTACYHACQYKPPHELQVNLPPVLDDLRHDSYANFAWPKAAAPLFRHNGRFSLIVVALSIVLTCGITYHAVPPAALQQANSAPGAFYAVIPHSIMAGIAGGITLFGLLSLSISSIRFARYCGLDRSMLFSRDNWLATLSAIATLQHLGGGHGEGCNTADERFSNQRRYFHQFTMWGFLLCCAATASATVYELFLGKLSPFPYTSLPVMLGTAGGIGLLIGPLGLLWLKRRAHAAAMPQPAALDVAFLIQLFFISLTGLVLLAWRETAAMPWLLIVHLALVYGFFITLPFGKFVHGIYRTIALLRYSADQQARL
jgi:citrate/tricarballylate utilization protein